MAGLISNENKVKESNKLNEDFSKGVKEINDKVEESKGKGKEIVKEMPTINDNNKHIALVQCERDDSIIKYSNKTIIAIY